MRVLGRCGLSCNRDGVLVPFADIEARLRRIPGVADAVVIGGGENLHGRELFAVCVPVRGHDLSEAAVRTACVELMPAYAIPDHVRLLDSLPLLASGKPDRRGLADTVLAGPHA
jgi:O-succinylbenzoic acid--CoA ligase